jgi:hypothetical protein
MRVKADRATEAGSGGIIVKVQAVALERESLEPSV